METSVISVEGMSCNHCKMAVEQGLKKLDGVSAAEVDLGAKNVTVTFDPAKLSLEDLKNGVREAGYEPQ